MGVNIDKAGGDDFTARVDFFITFREIWTNS